MSVYDISGNIVASPLDIDGETALTLYDIEGNLISTPSEPIIDNLTVMTFNVQRWTGINANTDMVNAIFDKYNPDIVGFQEYATSANSLVQNRFGNIAVSPLLTDAHIAVGSTHELLDATTVIYPEEMQHYQLERGYQKMYINIAGIRIAVFNTHLEYYAKNSWLPSNQLRVQQAAELLRATQEDEYFIIIGDINTYFERTEGANHFNDADYAEIIMPFINAGCNLANCTPERGFMYTCSDGTTAENGAWKAHDNIITSGNIAITNVVVDDTKLSYLDGVNKIDHLPLVAYLTVY